jgi:8-oxo-dGTP diphosphatase
MSAHEGNSSYPKPALTADVVVLAPRLAPVPGETTPGLLQLLLIRRGSEPFRGRWALPGGFCDAGESVEQAAARELTEEAGLRDVRIEQVRTFSQPGRDPRGWVVSVAHLALVPARRLQEVSAGSDASEARWWPVRPGGLETGPLAFDHDQILAAALSHLARDIDTLGPALLDDPASAEELALVRAAVLALSPNAPKHRG